MPTVDRISVLDSTTNQLLPAKAMDCLAFDVDVVVILQISVMQADMVMDHGLMVVIMIVIVIDDVIDTFNDCNIALRTPLSHYQ